MKKACYTCLICLFQIMLLSAQTPPVCSFPDSLAADECNDACIVYCQLEGYIGQTAGYTASAAPGFCGIAQNDQWLAFIAGGDSISITVSPANCQHSDGLETALYSDCATAPIACTPGFQGNGDQPSVLSALLVSGETYFLRINGYAGDACDFTITTSPASTIYALQVGPIGPVQGPTVVAENSVLVYSVDSSVNATSYHWTGPPAWKINGQTPPIDIPAPAGRQVTVTFGDEGGLLSVQAINDCSQGIVSEQRIFIGQEPLAPPCPANMTQAADVCSDACVQCNFNGYTGSTVGYTADPAPGFCGIVENNQWIGFVAGESAATFNLTASNCVSGNGLQMALYQNCTDPPLVCAEGNIGGAAEPLVIDAALQAGQNYFMMVDGYLGDQCDFTLAVNPPMAAQAPPLSAIGPINGLLNLCPGATVTYSVAAVAGALGYSWQAPPGWLINGKTGPYTGIGAGSNSVTVTASISGGQLSVFAFNSCEDGNPVAKNITVQPIPPTHLPLVTICAEDVPYILPWGDSCSTTTQHCFTFSSYLGCDSIVCQQVIIRSPIITFLPPKVICTGDSVVICGEAYTNGGSYSHICKSYLGCDSIVNFSILILEPVANIIPDQNLNCAAPPVVLNSTPSSGTKTWKLLNGDILGTGNSITVTQPGVYILEITASAGGSFCITADTIMVQFNDPPEAMALGGTITCNQPIVQLNGSSGTPGALYSWSGPDNFISNEKDPEVDVPGNYVLTVTDPQTACTATATALVLIDASVPVLPSLSDQKFDCIIPFVELPCPSLPPGWSCSWSGPGLVIGPGGQFQAVDSGFYQIVVTDQNGCTATDEIWVEADTKAPVITAYVDTINCSNPTGGMLHCSVDIPGVSCVAVFTGSAYIITATASNGCVSIVTVPVIVDGNVPSVAVKDDTLTCAQPSVTLVCMTNVTGALFSWTGPGGFSSMLQNPTVTLPGIYNVSVTDPGNGCFSTVEVTVPQDVQSPDIGLVQVTPDQNGQGIGAIDISVDFPGTYNTTWYLDGMFYSNSEDLSGLAAGNYEAVVTGSNGCTGTLQVTVLDTLVSTRHISADQFWEIFPNPASAILRLRYLGNDQPEAQIWLLDAAGRLVLQQTKPVSSDWIISCEKLPTGMYTVLIRTEDGVARKLVGVLR